MPELNTVSQLPSYDMEIDDPINIFGDFECLQKDAEKKAIWLAIVWQNIKELETIMF